MPFVAGNHNKNNDWKTFLPIKQLKREFTLVFNILELLQYSIFPELKNLMKLERDRRTERHIDVLRKPQASEHVLTHFGAGDRVRVVLMAVMTSAQGICTTSSVRLCAGRNPLTTWTKFRRSFCYQFAGGQE